VEAKLRRSRDEEPDEEALWVEALEEAIARTIQCGMKDYGLPQTARD